MIQISDGKILFCIVVNRLILLLLLSVHILKIPFYHVKREKILRVRKITFVDKLYFIIYGLQKN